MTARTRHLMLDLRSMLPHHKADSKVWRAGERAGVELPVTARSCEPPRPAHCLPRASPARARPPQLDASEKLSVINEIAASKSCGSVIYLEARKKRDVYLWLAASPSGPSAKFHVVNAHTTDELRLTGNALRGSRAILSFDRAFDEPTTAPHLRLLRELLARTLAPPRGHPRVQPFHDRVINLGLADGKIWFRHYAIVDKAVDAKAVARLVAAGEAPTVLVEIGPRFVLDPVRIFGGSFGGATLWHNAAHVAPNDVRREFALARAQKYTARITALGERRGREAALTLPPNPVDEVFADDGGAFPDTTAPPPPPAEVKATKAAAAAAAAPKAAASRKPAAAGKAAAAAKHARLEEALQRLGGM